MIEGYVEMDGRSASVYEYPLKAIWRSEYMRELRKEMLAGAAPFRCNRCYDYEAMGATSYRMMSNSLYPGIGNLPPSAASYAALPLDGDLADGAPDFYQLVLGNHCNLKCRMCSATFSSSIENDPVHNAWAPHTDARLPAWRREALSIGPRPALMVQQSGFGHVQWREGAPLVWTAAEAAMQLPWRDDLCAERLEVEIWDEPERDSMAVIEVNGVTREFQMPASGMSCLQFPLADLPPRHEMSVTIRSRSPAQSRGLPIKDVRLLRSAGRARGARNAFASRFSGDHAWQEQNSLLFGEILAEPERLRKLQITGGEPFLLPKTEEMLEYLIDTGVAGNITLNISTNCTSVSEPLVRKLGKFRRVELCLSIEGVDADQEYIRFPSKWAEVSANALRFKSLDNATLQINPTVQIYNFMRMHELIAWCNQAGINFYPQRLAHPPFLAIEVAPASARFEAARRIRDMLPDIAAQSSRHNAEALARMLVEGAENPADPAIRRDFMLFTNDLDRSRGQSFAGTHAELLEHFAASGVSWLKDTAHLVRMRV